jgi:hypothetical protein
MSYRDIIRITDPQGLHDVLLKYGPMEILISRAAAYSSAEKICVMYVPGITYEPLATVSVDVFRQAMKTGLIEYQNKVDKTFRAKVKKEKR